MGKWIPILKMRELGPLVTQRMSSNARIGVKLQCIWAWAPGHHATSLTRLFRGAEVGRKNCHWATGL